MSIRVAHQSINTKIYSKHNPHKSIATYQYVLLVSSVRHACLKLTAADLGRLGAEYLQRFVAAGHWAVELLHDLGSLLLLQPHLPFCLNIQVLDF